ncbi:hypothetical protein F5884DRAFT_809105 [Xylogone sp. PMI_703]|nr:hypothetical protein F5884DRAFT_808748 [Xylogone sp. PMI_703]KAH8800864.1 hypothetical protein F5884DRAFT_809105 [Xylogone sp. PMI_703]
MVKKERDRVLKKYVDKCREQSAAGNNATKGSYFLLHDAFDICKALGFGYETIEKLMYGYTDLERCHPVQNHSQVHAKDAIICGSIQANPKNSGVGKGGLGGNTHHKAKRKRTKKNDEAILEDAYVSCSKPDTEMYARLEDQVALSKQEIRKWFQNRRQKDRVSRHGGKLRSTYQSW